MAKLDDAEKALHARLLEAATDPAALATLGQELKAVQAEKAEAEDRWMELYEQVG